MDGIKAGRHGGNLMDGAEGIAVTLWRDVRIVRGFRVAWMRGKGSEMG